LFDHRSPRGDRELLGDDEVIAKLTPVLIVGTVAAGMVLATRFLLFRKVNGTVLFVAVAFGVPVAVSTYWILTPGH